MRAKQSFGAMAASTVAIAGMAFGGGQAFAYGAADQPVAQVEISGNCDNPTFPMCYPPPEGVGTGGVWAWAELDTSSGSQNASDPSPMDATASFCGHTVGGSGGPGGAGGGGGPDPYGVWYSEPSLGAALNSNSDAHPFYDPSQYQGSVYVLDFFPGAPHDFVVVVPAAQGHYSQHPAKGVSLQLQVAP